MAEKPGFLMGLANAYRHFDASREVSTREFTEACLAILPIFDHLGRALCQPICVRTKPAVWDDFWKVL